jgi:site-specific DNA recombinase
MVSRRPLLSGLLKCGTCGHGMSIKGADRGGTRIVCTKHHNAKACENNRTYYLHTIEETVLSGLRAHLVDTRAIRHFLKTYHDERKRLAKSAGSRVPALQHRLGEVTRQAARLTDLMLESHEPVSVFSGRIFALEKEKTAIEAEIASLGSPITVVTLHPGATRIISKSWKTSLQRSEGEMAATRWLRPFVS